MLSDIINYFLYLLDSIKVVKKNADVVNVVNLVSNSASILFIIASYVLMGIAIMKMSKKLNLNKGYLGFIPVLQLYQLGRISKTCKILSWRIKTPQIVLPILETVLVLSTIAGLAMDARFTDYTLDNNGLAKFTYYAVYVLQMLSSLGLIVFLISVFFNVYLQFFPNNSSMAIIVFVAVSVIMPFYGIILYIASRNNPIPLAARTTRAYYYAPPKNPNGNDPYNPHQNTQPKAGEPFKDFEEKKEDPFKEFGEDKKEDKKDDDNPFGM